MLELGSKILLCYLIGSIMGSLIVGRLKGGVDIRTMGSGNAGGTNALRTQGVVFALMVIVVDIGKGVIAALVVPGLEIPGVASDPLLSRETLMLGCANPGLVCGLIDGYFDQSVSPHSGSGTFDFDDDLFAVANDQNDHFVWIDVLLGRSLDHRG